MNNCIFCKILNGDVESSFVYRGEFVSAFMDLNPINEGHVLLVPNNHYERFRSINDDTVGDMFRVARDILSAIEESDIKCEGANLFLSDGEIAGQDLPHSHLHIAPRFKGDGHRMGFTEYNKEAEKREMLNNVAKEISKNLKGK